MQRIACTVLLLVLLAGNVPVGAAGIDVMGGTSFHNPVAAQIGDHYIENPQWRTRPFEDAYYYSIRIRWAGMEIEWLHDKIYLPDQPGIENFSVSDGYNLLLVNGVERWGRFVV